MKIKIIINSRSIKYRHRHVESILARKFVAHTIDVRWTEYPKHAINIAKDAAGKDYDTIIAVGGDGTINEIINGAGGAPITLGIIPTGTANDLASHLGISKDIESACDTIINGKVRPIDLICVNGWHFITAGGIGLPCAVLDATESDRQRHLWAKLSHYISGKHFYSMALLRVLMRRDYHEKRVILQTGDLQYRLAVVALIIGNQPNLGAYFQALPGAINSDGLFDVCTIEYNDKRFNLLDTLIKSIKGNHISCRTVRLFRTDSIIIKSNTPIKFFGDGEISLEDTVFKIKILPEAARIISPDTR